MWKISNYTFSSETDNSSPLTWKAIKDIDELEKLLVDPQGILHNMDMNSKNKWVLWQSEDSLYKLILVSIINSLFLKSTSTSQK